MPYLATLIYFIFFRGIVSFPYIQFSILRRDLNPQPRGCKSSPLTIEHGPLLYFYVVKVGNFRQVMVESSNRKTEFVLENATPVKFKMAISIKIVVGFTGFS